MKSALLDTNVPMDVFAVREPHYAASVGVWRLCESGQLRGFVSAISFTNIHYIVRKAADKAAADKSVKLLRQLATIVACDEEILDSALNAGFLDFEDAVQYFSAKRAGAECVITRNQDHFRRADLPVMSPAQFLAAYFPE